MANRDAPMGLRPSYHLTGGVMRTQRYKIQDGAAVAIFRGDLVTMDTTTRAIVAGSAPATGATGAPFVGVFWGCSYLDANGNVIYSKQWPAAGDTQGSTLADAYVYDDPMIVFEIQCDGAFTATDIGANADMVYTVGNTAIGNSKTELDSSDIGTGLNLHIVDVVERADNVVGTNANVYVLINEHSLDNAGAARFEIT